MLNCSSCGAKLQEGRPFCDACGRVPGPVLRISYGMSWGFALVGLLAAAIWWFGDFTSASMPTSAPIVPLRDDAAKMIGECGSPDADSIVPSNVQTGAAERRWLAYKKAKIKAGFERDTPANPKGWKNVGILDLSSKKQLKPEQVSKRLPCAENLSIAK